MSYSTSRTSVSDALRWRCRSRVESGFCCHICSFVKLALQLSSEINTEWNVVFPFDPRLVYMVQDQRTPWTYKRKLHNRIDADAW